MKELIYTLLELEKGNKKTCDFCSNLYGEDNKSVSQIRTRSKLTNKLVANNVVCEECKEKFENDELPKCDKCGRLQNETDINLLKFGVKCKCEGKEEKELPNLPQERESMTAFYERQINGLREELATTEEALEIEREEVAKFQEKSEEWGKRQKQELLDRIKELEAEVEKLKKQTPQALVEEIRELKKQLEQFQQATQIEVPPKDNGKKIKNFFKFGSK